MQPTLSLVIHLYSWLYSEQAGGTSLLPCISHTCRLVLVNGPRVSFWWLSFLISLFTWTSWLEKDSHGGPARSLGGTVYFWVLWTLCSFSLQEIISEQLQSPECTSSPWSFWLVSSRAFQTPTVMAPSTSLLGNVLQGALNFGELIENDTGGRAGFPHVVAPGKRILELADFFFKQKPWSKHCPSILCQIWDGRWL